MEFLKKHYEKLILSIVLLGLAGVAATLPMKVNQEKQKEEERKNSLIGAKVTPYPPIDLTTNKAILEKVKTPIHFDIAGKHNLFNPVPWIETPNGELVKVKPNTLGIGALEVTAIHPLQMIVSFDDIVPTAGPGGTNEFRYNVTVVREGAANPKQGPRAMYEGLTAGGIGTLKKVVGPADNPTSLMLELPDHSMVTISKEKPFKKIIGYAADLHCELPPLDRKNTKVADTFPLGPEVYKVQAIDTNVVVLRDTKTQKQYQKELTKTVANEK
jgi:hypothetical protein